MNIFKTIPLHQDMTTRFVPVIIGIMVYLATLCLSLTVMGMKASSLWESKLIPHIMLDIPFEEGMADKSEKILSALKKRGEVEKAFALTPEEIRTNLQNILKTDIPPDLGDLPILIQIQLKPGKRLDKKTLIPFLRSLVPDFELVDDYQWQDQILILVNTLIFVSFFLSFLILCATLSTAIFATRTSLLIHQNLLELLHLMGATQGYILRQFQGQAFWQTLISGFWGAGFALLTTTGIMFSLATPPFSTQLPLFIDPLLGFYFFYLFIFITLTMSFLTTITVRWTVKRFLYSR